MAPIVNPSARKCPFCQKPTSPTAARCVHCNQRIVEFRQREAERSIDCPDCGKVAGIVRLGTIELDLCETCGGLWFDRSELERLAKEVSPAVLSDEIHALMARLTARKSANKTYPLCPLCHDSMNLAQYQEVSGVVVHRCQTCGVWIDGANTVKFFVLFEQGRLDELSARAARTKTAALEARIASLENTSRGPATILVAGPAEVSHAPPSGIFLLFDLLGFLASLFDE